MQGPEEAKKDQNNIEFLPSIDELIGLEERLYGYIKLISESNHNESKDALRRLLH
jgi:hypothetical protein